MFLVTVSGSPEDPPAQISAEATVASISVEPRELPPGMVGEVTVVPIPVSTVEELVVTITASRGDIQRREQRTLQIEPAEDDLAVEAGAHLAPFVDWLAVERPELGIGPTTAWEATPGAHVLVVSHYLYFSEEWEVGLEWHIMIPPSDWTRIYLRHRWTETRPSLAFEISSFAAGDEPQEIAPPESVWR